MSVCLREMEEQQLKTAKATKRAGIYMIYCKENLRSYIGSAHNLNNRLYDHRSTLKKNKHANAHLQRIYNKYGVEALTFIILEYVDDTELLLTKEQVWINSLGSINICKVAGNTTGVRPSEETRKKLSKAGKGVVRSQEFKETLSASIRNMWAEMSETDKEARVLKMKATKAAKSENEKQSIRDKLSRSRTGQPGYWNGKSLPTETKNKIREARTGTKLSEEHKLKISLGVRNLPIEKKIEISKKLSLAHKGRKKSQDHINAMRNARLQKISM